MDNVRIDQLADKIVNAVREYTAEVSEAISKEVNAQAAACLNEIKANSARWPDYAKGWKVVTDKKFDSVNIYGVTRRIIWNPANYRIVHLLEKGHAKRGGGRVQAYPHVLPAEQKYVALLQMRIHQIVSRGG